MKKYFALLCLTLTAAFGAADYHDIAALVGPCAQEPMALAHRGELEKALELARDACARNDGPACADLWLVYAFCATKLETEDAVRAGEGATRALPNSAAAHLFLARALLSGLSSSGLLGSLRIIRNGRDELETAVQLDPDCHPARAVLATIYTLPKIAGGNPEKLQAHLEELDRRNPYFAALAHGRAAVGQRDFSAARTFFARAHELAPDDPEPIKGSIDAASRDRDFAGAFRAWEQLRPAFPGDGSRDALFVDLSVKSASRQEEALEASKRYLASAKASPLARAHVELNTAVLLHADGQDDAAKKLVAAAETRWTGAADLYTQLEKRHRKESGAKTK
jgi:tetratricopeptide (TPR) repeat protein